MCFQCIYEKQMPSRSSAADKSVPPWATIKNRKALTGMGVYNFGGWGGVMIFS